MNPSNSIRIVTFNESTHTPTLLNRQSPTEEMEFVTKQLETKLRTSHHLRHPSPNRKSRSSHGHRSYENKDHLHTGIQSSIIHNNDNNTILSSIPRAGKRSKQENDDQPVNDEVVANQLTNSKTNDPILEKLFQELAECKNRQALLLNQIQQIRQKSKRWSPPVTYYLPLNSLNDNDIPSLQDAFQQRKSTFIQQSKNRVNEIYRHHHHRHHRRIIPTIKTNNSYLKQRRQHEYDRFCAIMTKHQNRQNAKIYGNLIKNSILLQIH